MKYLLLLLVCTQLYANTLKMENGEIMPFSNSRYPVKDFIKDYALLMKLNVTYPSDLIPKDSTVHIELNTKITAEEMKKVFYATLGDLGYTGSEERNILWLNNSRDIRYIPTDIYTDLNFPRDARYSTVIYKLKYPLSSEICRNIRPFLSRYGRVVDLSDARTIIFNDRGDNTERLINTIKNMDSEDGYKALITFKPKEKLEEEENNPLKEKIMSLELEKKLLEEKLLKTMSKSPIEAR